MRCKKCNQELNDNALFCAHCGTKTKSIASYLKLVAVIGICVSVIGLGNSIAPAFNSEMAADVNEFQSMTMSGLWMTWSVIFNLLILCLSGFVIKNCHIFEKALLIKKLGIGYLFLIILNGTFKIMYILKSIRMVENLRDTYSVNTDDMYIMVYAALFGVILHCVLPTLYIVITSKINKMSFN